MPNLPIAALKRQSVRSMFIVDFLEPVIRWHQTGLAPLGGRVSSDPRTRFIEGDFFALASNPETGFDASEPGRKFHAILLDIDHTPQHWLNERHASFYTLEGLKSLRLHLVPGGVFAPYALTYLFSAKFDIATPCSGRIGLLTRAFFEMPAPFASRWGRVSLGARIPRRQSRTST